MMPTSLILSSAINRSRPILAPSGLRWLVVGVVLLLLAALPGCAVSSYTTARNLAEGDSSFWVAPQVMRVGVAAKPTNMPFVELGTRYGITDDVEVGMRLGAGVQSDVKLSLKKPKNPDEKLTIAIAPGLGYIGNFSGTPTGADGDDLHFVGATVPVYVTWGFSETVSMTVGPRVTWLMQYVETASASTTHTVAAGTSLSVAWRVSKRVTIAPEISFAMPMFRALTGAGSVFGTGDQRVLHLGVGFIFGG
ncbi:MAG: hypothetical protein KC502_20440 [Myxococcales bacterium]|nr:hypothetical protein [Myxococcales bacterium]